jgi:ABC-2 type transport system ATP-binding protein
VRGLRQGYGRTPIIESLDLTVSDGVFGLLGPNGAGKTTLLRTLATASSPLGGEVRLLQRDIEDHRALREIRRRIGFLPQHFGYFPGFTVREFLEYTAWLREVPRTAVLTRCDDALGALDLGGVAKAKLRTLSGGTLRRVGIAQAIVNDPELLILDEPTSGLDPEQRATFRELLRRRGERAAVIVATHLVEDVAAACTNVAVMFCGRIVFRGSRDELAMAGAPDALGDTPLERGYSTMLAAARAAA